MSFHRLTTPTYYMSGGWPPAGYDYINLTPGDPNQAPADGAKSGGHASDGSYFIVFAEDATSSHANRGHKALAQNCDQLDDWLHGSVPVPAEITGTASGSVAYIEITDDVFVGTFGTSPTVDELNQLMVVLIKDAGYVAQSVNGIQIRPATISASGGGASIVGTEASGFHTNVRVTFNTPILNGTDYRLVYLKRSSLAKISATDFEKLTRGLLRGCDYISFGGTSAWADGVTNDACSINYAVQRLIAHLTITSGKYGAGKLSKGVSPPWADSTTIAATNLSDWLDGIVSLLADTSTGSYGTSKIGSRSYSPSAPQYGFSAGTLFSQLVTLAQSLTKHAFASEVVDMATYPSGYTLTADVPKIFVDSTADPMRIILPQTPANFYGMEWRIIDQLGMFVSQNAHIERYAGTTYLVNGDGTSDAAVTLAANYGQWVVTCDGVDFFIS